MAAKKQPESKKAVSPGPPRPAASIVLLRPKRGPEPYILAEDFEVLMMERSNKQGAFKGAVVFPGGVIELDDRVDEWGRLLGIEVVTRLHVLKIGAVRELFEETGILLSQPESNLSREQARHLRSRVQKDGSEFLKVCHELQVKPDLDALKFVHQWVTPPPQPKRFDTYFFLAIKQEVRGAEADGGETVRVGWSAPSHFIELFAKQEVSFLPPQFYLLSTLAGTPTLSAIAEMHSAVNESEVHPWRPHTLSKEQGGPAMCYPGDAAYPPALGTSPLVKRPKEDSDRHRLYLRPVAKREGGAGGRGILGGDVVMYELERTVPVPFGGESWATARLAGTRAKF